MRRSEHILEEFLVASARLGDMRAFDKLVRLRTPKLLAHAYRLLGDREQAHDVVQDVWLDILRGLSNLQDDRAFAAWTFKITTRRCAGLIDRLVKDRRNASEIADIQMCAGSGTSDTAETKTALRQAIAQLPSDQRVTIALFYLEGLGVGEISAALEIPTGTVKSRLSLARAKLKTTLQGE